MLCQLIFYRIVIARLQRLHQTEENDWEIFYSTYYFSMDCFVPYNDEDINAHIIRHLDCFASLAMTAT